jgi:hypothetical protein
MPMTGSSIVIAPSRQTQGEIGPASLPAFTQDAPVDMTICDW